MKEERIINNQYLIIREIGAGGFATVYKAWDSVLQRVVTIKKIHEEYSNDAKYMDMFHREVINTVKLEHENIVKVVNFIKDDNEFYVVIDYVKGVDLGYLLNKCHKNSIKIPIDIGLYIILEVLKALDYAHTIKNGYTDKPLNIVHKNISPGNVMLYFDGRIKLADFGITGKKEKISYMSPEQAEVKTDIDARSDLFSLGVILYEILTGEKVFWGDTELDIWRKVRHADVDFEKLQKYEISNEIQEIFKKILQKLPEERYQSAAEVYLEIKRYLSKKCNIEELIGQYKSFLAEQTDKEVKAMEEEMEIDSKLIPLEPVEKLTEPPGKVEEAEEVEAPAETPEEQTPAEQTPAETPEEQVPAETPEEQVPAETPEEQASAEHVPAGTPAEQVPATPDTYGPLISPEVSVSGEDKEKTIFDFVLDTAKRYKKIFISISAAIFIAFISFSVLDTYMQFTGLGIKLHNIIWPPALELDTIPSGAKVELLKGNVDIIEANGYKTETPSYIEKIQPGLYTLKFIKENYGEMVRIVTVFGRRKETQSIAIAGAKVVNGVYVIPFEVVVEINSIPSGAGLFIDGKKVGKTPFTGSLEIGMHNFYLVKDGFETLGKHGIGDNFNEVKPTMGICVLDTSKAVDKQSSIDYRFWNVKEIKTKTGGKKFVLDGTLWKNFSIASIPSQSEVYIDDTPDSIGSTPLERLILTAGKHIVLVEKDGYIPWAETVEVSGESLEHINVTLKKEITIYSYCADGGAKDLGAKIIVAGTKISGKTPLKVTLPHGRYTFKLTKYPAYKPATITRHIGKLKDKLNVKMELMSPHLKVEVKDYATGKTIKDATIWVDGAYWRRTNSMGIVSDYIYKPSGEFDIKVSADKYDDFRTLISIKKGQRKKIRVILGVPKDGKIIVKIPDEFLGTSVYLNGEYIGEDSQVISEVLRSYHNVEFKFNNFNKSAVKKIKIDKSNQVLILSPVYKGPEIVIQEEYLPYLKVTVKDYKTNFGIKSASVFINDTLWKQTGKTGEVSGYLEEHCGELKIRIESGDYEAFNTVTFIEINERKELEIKLGVPEDGTVVLDIPDEIYDASVYLDGEYIGENLTLISDVLRSRHVIEIKSSIFKEKVFKTFSLDKPDQLIMLQLVKKDAKFYLKELSLESFWQQYE